MKHQTAAHDSTLSVIRLAALICLGLNSAAWCDEAYTIAMADLDNPSGIAIQPGTGHLFVAESGSGRVLRIVDGKPEAVIVGLAERRHAAGERKIGLVGLGFIDGQTLAVGGGTQRDGGGVIQIARVPEPGGDPLDSDSLLRLEPADRSAAGAAIVGLAASKSAVYVTCSGDDNTGWMAQADIKNLNDLTVAKSFGRLVRFPDVKESAGFNFPVGLTLSARGEIVVGQTGKNDAARDSQLTFYRSTDGKRLLSLDTGLFDIVAVGYGVTTSPSRKARLYALDFAQVDPAQSGLYRLDAGFAAGKQTVRPVRIASLERPTGMALADDGSMYVTVLGPAANSAGAKPGRLLKFEPGL